MEIYWFHHQVTMSIVRYFDVFKLWNFLHPKCSKKRMSITRYLNEFDTHTPPKLLFVERSSAWLSFVREKSTWLSYQTLPTLPFVLRAYIYLFFYFYKMLIGVLNLMQYCLRECQISWIGWIKGRAKQCDRIIRIPTC